MIKRYTEKKRNVGRIVSVDGNIYDDADEILSVNIVFQRMYNMHLEPVIEELNIYYFQDGAELRKDNLDSVMLELKLLMEWITDHVEGDDREYLLCRLHNIRNVILKSLKNDDDFEEAL